MGGLGATGDELVSVSDRGNRQMLNVAPSKTTSVPCERRNDVGSGARMKKPPTGD